MSPLRGKTERRAEPRDPVEIRSREDAHKVVEQVAHRDPENSSVVKAWRTAKDSTWLSLLAGSFLLLFFVSVIYEVIKLTT